MNEMMNKDSFTSLELVEVINQYRNEEGDRSELGGDGHLPASAFAGQWLHLRALVIAHEAATRLGARRQFLALALVSRGRLRQASYRRQTFHRHFPPHLFARCGGARG